MAPSCSKLFNFGSSESESDIIWKANHIVFGVLSTEYLIYKIVVSYMYVHHNSTYDGCNTINED